MPRYYFDIVDGEHTSDEDGVVIPDPCLLPRSALRTLLEIGAHEVVHNDARALAVSVRDEGGTVVYRATLNIEGGWTQT